MHGRFTHVVDRVHVGLQLLHQQADRLQHLRLARAILVRGPRDARRRHERRDVVLGVDRRVGAVLEQQPHHFDIRRLGGQHERGGAGHVPAVPRARPAGLLHRVPAVDVRAVIEERPDHPQPVEVHVDELIADMPVRDVHGSLQDTAEDVAGDDAFRLALAVAELADFERHRFGPHSLDCQPGRASLRVRVRAPFEQQVDEVLVAVDRRHEQRSGSVRPGIVHVGSRRQQGPDGADAPLARGKQERRRAAVGAGGDIGAARDQRLDDRDVTLGGGPHEGRLAVPGFLRVGVGPRVGQYLHRLGLPGPRGQHQWRFAGVDGLLRVVRIDAGGQQQGQDPGVAGAGREGQRRDAVVVRRVNVGSRADQRRRSLRVVPVGGPVDGPGAVALRGVDIGIPGEQRPDRRGVAALHGVGERGFRFGCRRDGDGGSQAGNHEHRRQRYSGRASSLQMDLP